MNKPVAALVLVLSFASFCWAAPKKPVTKTPAKAIRLEGATQYTQQELFAAVGLEAQMQLDANGIKARGKALSDTGLFDVVRFRTDAKSIVFTVTPAKQLYPMRIDNLPLAPGDELDGKLRAAVPLYRGQLPGAGTVVEGVRAALEQMLAAQGVKATVKAALTSGLGPQKITAVNFSIASPAVKIGAIRLVGVSSPMQAKVNTVAAGQSDNDYDTNNTAAGLEHVFVDLYQGQGYAAVEVSVTQGAAVSSAEGIAVPFTLTVKEGGLYKLGTITYPADAMVARAEVDKLAAKYPAGSGRPLDLFLMAVRDAYHARGYLDSATESRASFNETTRIVNYTVAVTPGAQYQLGGVKFDGAPDAMVARLNKVWKMAGGAAFDESYLQNFSALAQKQDKTLGKWIQTMLVTSDEKDDAVAHTVNCTIHFVKAAGK